MKKHKKIECSSLKSVMNTLNGGQGWIRTIEVVDGRFTVCSLWPLGNLPLLNWSWWTDSNPRPADYKSAALPTELHQRIAVFRRTLEYNITEIRVCQHFFLNFFDFFQKNFLKLLFFLIGRMFKVKPYLFC